MSKIPRTATATIASAAALSPAIFIGGSVTQINLPATWTAAAMTFQVSEDNVTYRDLYDQNGVERNFTVAASRGVILKPSEWVSIRYVKVRSGTAGVTVNQNQITPVQFVYREFE